MDHQQVQFFFVVVKTLPVVFLFATYTCMKKTKCQSTRPGSLVNPHNPTNTALEGFTAGYIQGQGQDQEGKKINF